LKNIKTLQQTEKQTNHSNTELQEVTTSVPEVDQEPLGPAPALIYYFRHVQSPTALYIELDAECDQQRRSICWQHVATFAIVARWSTTERRQSFVYGTQQRWTRRGEIIL